MVGGRRRYDGAKPDAIGVEPPTELDAIGHAQPTVHLLEVLPDGMRADAQELGDLLGRRSDRGVLRDLELARTKHIPQVRRQGFARIDPRRVEVPGPDQDLDQHALIPGDDPLAFGVRRSQGTHGLSDRRKRQRVELRAERTGAGHHIPLRVEGRKRTPNRVHTQLANEKTVPSTIRSTLGVSPDVVSSTEDRPRPGRNAGLQLLFN